MPVSGKGDEPGSHLATALDNRPIPPVCKIQRGMGRFLTYQLFYSVQTISFQALEHEKSILPTNSRVPQQSS